jgi:anthranilate synthase/aminodeoxychorismate synthase-like glutamine amidotransferase
MIIVIDNYDSFTYNLVQDIRQIGYPVTVYRNDAVSVANVTEAGPQAVVISPGPGRPEDAGICLDLIAAMSGKTPLLGVCLGHQCIVQAFGGVIVNAGRLMHGKTSMVTADGQTLFKGIKSPFQAMRYHSLVADRERVPKDLEISAESEDGEIMGIRHRSHMTEGIQFHPESIMTPVGKRLMRNFLRMAAAEG